ncbi:MAG: glycosyltransferase involved in cell wall biosynthesis [Gammaproteobacteria bacterium]|jgi:glycosyltransferase involved in cell wall biosynthesis
MALRPDISIIYSVVIPAFNEEAFLPRTLQRLKNSMDKIEEQGEIIVVDNNSSDKTAEIARDYAAHVIFEAVNQISKARNAGAKAASGKYLIFLDADTLIDEKLIQTALNALKSGAVCGGGTLVALEGETPLIAKLFLSLWNWSSIKLNLAAGCFIYCLREAFEAVNGFSEEVYASEEIWLSRALGIWGKQFNMKFHIIGDHPIVTSNRKLDWYTPGRLVLFYLPIVIFPPLVRIQYFCSSWYQRPGKQ